jgi:hypothetical protein
MLLSDLVRSHYEWLKWVGLLLTFAAIGWVVLVINIDHSLQKYTA